MLLTLSKRKALLTCLLGLTTGTAFCGQRIDASAPLFNDACNGSPSSSDPACDTANACAGSTLCDGSNWNFKASPCDECESQSNCGDGSCCPTHGLNSAFETSEAGLFGFGLLKKSEMCFDDFVSPMTNPVYFEDPRQLTEARAIFLNHKLPFVGALGVPGGRVQVYALQARLRLTERLSLIAVKDGYVVSQSPIVDDGWADLSVGLKYSLYRDSVRGQLISVGARFESPTGENRALQGNGDGVFDFFVTGGTRLGEKSHWLSASGLVVPVDSNAENRWFYWSNHLDRQLGESKFYALAELNWYNYLSSGNAFPLPIEGGDLFNLGSPGVTGNNIVTNAYGLKYKPNRHLESGVAWEFPMTAHRGVMDNRLTVDLILRY